MIYLTETDEIKHSLKVLSTADILWLDTEVADYLSKKPRLSLIQVLADALDRTGEQVYIFDVLDSPNLGEMIIQEILENPQIEKVFHHAKYDLKFLGQTRAKNCTCTWEMAKKLPYHLLPLPDLKLKTLAEHLCNFTAIDKTEQGSDWGCRPLSETQLNYAKLDPVYLAQVHCRLLELTQIAQGGAGTDDLESLSARHQEIFQQWKCLDSEINWIESRIKKAMQTQNIAETPNFKLAVSQRETTKTSFAKLSQVVQKSQINLDFEITLTAALKKQLEPCLKDLNPTIEIKPVYSLKAKHLEGETE